eukprot:gene6058-12217_t
MSQISRRICSQNIIEIPVENKEAIYLTLHEIRTQSHLYSYLWTETESAHLLFNRAVELITLYKSYNPEINSLICWLIDRLTLGTKLSPEQQIELKPIIEILIELGFEYPFYELCFSILETFIEAEEGIYEQICNIGLNIIEKFKGPIKAPQFLAFVFLILKYIEKYFDKEDIAILAMKVLASAAHQVDLDNKRNFFFHLIIPTIMKFFTINTLRCKSITVTASFLRGLICLHTSHASQLIEYGFLPLLQTNLLDMSAESESRAEILLLFTELCKQDPSLQPIIIQDFPLEILLEAVGFEEGIVLEASVELFMAAYVPPRTPSSLTTQSYLRGALSRSIDLIATKGGDIEILQGCRTIRRLHRSVNLLQNDLNDITRRGRDIILDLFDHIELLTMNTIIIVDALSALCGWRKLYWRTLKSLEIREIVNCLEDIRQSGLSHDSDCDSDGIVEVDDSLMDANFTMTTSVIKDEDEGKISAELLEYLTLRLLANKKYLDDFVLKWKEYNYIEILRCIIYMQSIVHCLGMEVLETIINIHSLNDILVEILLFNKFGVSDFDYIIMEERCLAMLSDITLSLPTSLQAKVAVCEHVIKIVSIWSNLKNVPLMLNCIAMLVVLSFSDKTGPIGTLIMESIEQLDCIPRKIGGTLALSPLLFLCREIIPSVSDLDGEGLLVLLGWCVRGLRCTISRTRMRACQIIHEIGGLHPRLFQQTVSRREIEEGLLSTLVKCTEATHAIEAIKALSVCIRQLNLRPLWTYDDWVFHWSVKRRFLIQEEMGFVICNSLSRFRGAQKSLVLAFCLDFAAAVFTSTILDKKSDLHRILIDKVVPEVPSAMRYFLSEMNYDGEGEMVSSPSTKAANSTEIAVIATELLAFHTLQLLQSFLCYDVQESMDKLHLYSDTPLGHAVPSIMKKFPKNVAIQRFGIDILRIFALKTIDIELLGVHAPSAIIGAMELCPTETDFMRAFCTISEILAKKGDEEMKEKLYTAGIHRSLYNVLQTCSRELAPQGLSVLSAICDTKIHAETLVKIGYFSVVLRVLDRHCDAIKVQVEGLRALVALLEAPDSMDSLIAVDGRNSVNRVRTLLSHHIKESSLGPDYDPLDISLLVKSPCLNKNNQNTKCACVIS